MRFNFQRYNLLEPEKERLWCLNCYNVQETKSTDMMDSFRGGGSTKNFHIQGNVRCEKCKSDSIRRFPGLWNMLMNRIGMDYDLRKNKTKIQLNEELQAFIAKLTSNHPSFDEVIKVADALTIIYIDRSIRSWLAISSTGDVYSGVKDDTNGVEISRITMLIPKSFVMVWK